MRPPSMGFFSLCLFRLFNGKSKVFHYSVPSLECAIAPSIHRGYRPNCIPERTRRRIERRAKKNRVFPSFSSFLLLSSLEDPPKWNAKHILLLLWIRLRSFSLSVAGFPTSIRFVSGCNFLSQWNWMHFYIQLALHRFFFLPFFWVGVPL